MRRFLIGLFLAAGIGLVPGCGGASGIQEGMPDEAAPPADFDPGGDAQPNMSGRPAPKAK